MPKKVNKILLAVAVPVVFVFGLSALKNGATEKGELIKVKAVAVEKGEIASVVPAGGQINTLNYREIKSEVKGRVKSLKIEEGSMVRAGDILCTIDEVNKKEIETARKNLELALIDFEISLRDLNATRKKYERELKSSAVEVEKAEKELSRCQKLYEARAVPRRQLIEAESAVEKAKVNAEMAGDRSSVEDAEIRLKKSRMSLNEVEKELILVAAGQIKSLELPETRDEVEGLRRKLNEIYPQLGKVDIVAPIEGRIIKVGIREGQEINREILLFEIADMDKAVAELKVDEFDLSKVKVGQEVKMQTIGVAPHHYSGRILKIGTSVERDGQCPQVKATASIEPKGKGLMFGGSITARIVTERKTNVLTIPLEAIVRDETGQEMVYLAQGGQAVSRKIKVGLWGEDLVEVIEGLTPGEKAIAEGSAGLKGGEAVEVELVGLNDIRLYEGTE